VALYETEGIGEVFQLRPPTVAGGAWTAATLHVFQGNQDGLKPNPQLIVDDAGAVYGTTYSGDENDGGIVFQLVPPASAAGAWTENILGQFSSSNEQGDSPNGIAFYSGLLYGTTASGQFFQFTPPASAGGAWQETTLAGFGEEDDGPQGLQLNNGAFYGTADDSGITVGGVYQIVP
jgi:hypothetical protein